MLVIFLAFAPTFVILTISYEGLFFVAFCVMMLTWVHLEHLIYQEVSHLSPGLKENSNLDPKSLSDHNEESKNGAAVNHDSLKSSDTPAATTLLSNESDNPYRPLTLSDIRPSLFTLYLLQSAFFSTGNIASVSSFSLDAVYRLIPVFDPFSQAALLILKILIPFIILSATLGVLNKRLGFAPGALFMGLIVFGDWLTVNFFWMVKDEGSWLEIGETISRFCIVSALCVFSAGIEAGSGWLVGDVDDGE
jgi:GPI ethanolamine phosphate transferase 1